jgi:hypothetical protein
MIPVVDRIPLLFSALMNACYNHDKVIAALV